MPAPIVIVGASHTGAALADALHREKWAGSIVLIGDERTLPYHRPPLSKDYLAGTMDDDRLPIRDASFFTERGIEVKLGRRVAAVDRAAKTVRTDDGDAIVYTGLAFATGARPRQLGVPGENLAGVFMLRTIDDVRGIRAHLDQTKTAVIVGGGFIGLECAASLKKLGKQVTVLEARERLMPRVVPPLISDFYMKLHADHGVDVLCNAGVTELIGENGRVTGVVRTDGSILPADLVVVGVGVVPNIELAQDCGLACDNGIVVDEFARTSDPAIVAAGDCANHPNRYLGGRCRLESVQNATDQARSAAASLVGKQVLYDVVPWFWSDQYDVKLQMVGTSMGHTEHAIRGDIAARKFSAFYFRDGTLTGVDSLNAPIDHMAARKLIATGVPLRPAQAADPSFDLRTLKA
ncbi:MAG TPA: FAD-dependent oxidoreductase [Magnetospirillaceae bacterium]|jgi:3-phenylpropionate/trans-cinnamate dioxygenase ferredoxin reductase subunit